MDIGENKKLDCVEAVAEDDFLETSGMVVNRRTRGSFLPILLKKCRNMKSAFHEKSIL